LWGCCHHCGIENEVANETTAEVVQQETENVQEEAAAEEQSQDCKISYLLFLIEISFPTTQLLAKFVGFIECQVWGRGLSIVHG
jgi:hypothetical protein